MPWSRQICLVSVAAQSTAARSTAGFHSENTDDKQEEQRRQIFGGLYTRRSAADTGKGHVSTVRLMCTLVRQYQKDAPTHTHPHTYPPTHTPQCVSADTGRSTEYAENNVSGLGCVLFGSSAFLLCPPDPRGLCEKDVNPQMLV